MMNTTKKSTLKLPRLRTKEELLKTSPDLFKKLLLSDDLNSARSTSPSTTTKHAIQRPQHSAGGSGSTKSLSRSAGQSINYHDSPRGFGDEPLTLDQELTIELESVKRERQSLLESISHVRAEAGSAGSEAQQTDIRQLLKELELKKAKLNELKGQSRRAELQLSKLMDDNTDAVRLTPDDMLQEKAYIQSLEDEMASIQRDLEEGDAKNRLYQLLLERTKREHMSVDQKVRDKQECKRNCLEDLSKLSDALGATRAAKEMGEKELAKVRRQVDEARGDWMKKIRERRMEVRDLEKAQQKAREKEVRRREKLLEKERAEHEEAIKMKVEMEAYELQVAALAPRVEAMEAQWNRLRAISGAETPEDVIAYWEALRHKRLRMQDLVRLAERREAACKDEMSRLLQNRSTMLEASAVADATAASAAAAAASTAAAYDQDSSRAGTPATGATRTRGSSGGHDADADTAAVAAQIESAEKKVSTAKTQFMRLHKVCVAAEQGLASLLKNLQLALGEPGSPSFATTMCGTMGPGFGTTRPQGPPSASAASESTRRSQTGGPASAVAARDVRSPGSTGSAGRGAKAGAREQQLADSTASKNARFKGTSGARGASGASTISADSGTAQQAAAAAAAMPGVEEDGPGGLSSMVRPQLPSRGRNTIDDDSFFDCLPELLASVTSRLEKLLEAEESVNLEDLKEQMGLMLNTSSSPSTARSAGDALSGGTGSAQDASSAVVAAEAAAFEAAAAEVANAAAAKAAAEAAAATPPPAVEPEHSAAEQEASELSATAAAAAAEGEGSSAALAGQGGGTAGAEVVGGAGAEASGSAGVAPGEEASTLTTGTTAASASGGGEPSGVDAQATAASLLSFPSMGGSLLREKSGVPPAALAVGGEHSMAIPPSEKALMKGLYRRTWTGAPWLDTISAAPVDMVPSMKRKKGKRKEGGPQVDVSRILGYTAGDVDAESESEPSDDDGDGNGAGMVLDRDWIKMRAAKMVARHNAKQAAAAAALAQHN